MKLRDAIEVLEKRRAWLAKRITASERDLSYDKDELAALELALEIMRDELL